MSQRINIGRVLFRSLLLLGLAAGFVWFAPTAQAQTRWTGNTSGNYGTTTNWIGGTVPNSNTAGIQLGPNNVTNLALNLTTTFTASNITFNSAQAYSFTNGTLTLNTTSANSTILMGNTGSLNIASAVTLGRTLNIQTTAGNSSTLTIAGTLTTNNNAIYYNGTGSGTVNISSIIGGSSTVTQDSTGILTLGGTNTFTGNTTLNSGTLNINNVRAIGASGNFVINGGNIDNTSGGTITLTTTTKPMIWNGNFGFTGTNALSMNTNAVTLGANVSLNTGGSTLTVAGVITDGTNTFNLTKDGPGTLVLSGANTYNGTTTLNAGTLDIQNARALGIGGNIIINGGNIDNGSAAAITEHSNHTYNLNGDFGFTGTQALSLNTSAVTLGANVALTTGGSTLTIAGVIDDGANTFGLTKNGAAGTLVLTAANTFNGNVTLNAGTLTIQNARATGTGGTLVINGGNLDSSGIAMSANNAQVWSGNWFFNGGGTLNMGTGGVTLSNDVNLNTIASTLTIGGNITDGGSGFDITKSGAGTLVLTGTNSYSGNTNLTAGTLNISQFSLQNSTLNFTGGTLTLTGTAWTIGGLAGNQNINPGAGHAITLNNAFGTSANYTGVLSSSSSLTMNGDGTQIMGGANSYTGITTINSGTLAATTLANGGTASGIGQATGAATTLVFNGGTLQYLGSGSTTNRLFTVQSSTATIDSSGSGALMWGNTGAIVFNGTGAARTINLTGNNSGNNTFQLQITDNGANKTGVLKDGVGVWVLNATNSTYTGVTTINGGTLVISNITNGGVGGNIGAATGDAANLIIDGGTLSFNGTAATGATNRLFSIGANGTTLLSNNSTAANFMNWSNTSALGFTGVGNRTLTLGGVNTGNNTLAAIIGNNGSDVTSLTKADAGQWVLSGANTFTGNTSITGGTLLLNNNMALQSSVLNYNTLGGVISFGNLTNATIGGLSGAQNLALPTSLALTLNTGSLVIVTYSGVLSGTSANVTKSGLGTQTLSGNNTYTGLTTISAGTLVLSGNNTTSGNVVVNGGNLAINNGGNATSSALGTGRLILTSGNIDNTSGSTKTLLTNNAITLNGTVGFTGSNALNLGTGAVTLGANSTLTTGGSTLTFGGNISDGGNAYSITENGTGTIVLSGIDTFTGNYNLQGGTLNLNNIQALQFSVLNYTGGSITWTGSQWSIGGLGGNQNITLPNSSALTINTSSTTNVTYSGVLAGTSATVTKTGSGTQHFSGNNTYTGATTINAGTLAVSTLANGGSASGIGQSTGAATNLIFNGGTLSFEGTSNQSTNRLFTLQTGGGTIENNGSGNLALGNTGTIVFNGTNTARTLTLGGTNTGNNYFSLQITNNGTGNTSLVKNGVGTWILNGTNNTYSGGTSVNAGMLVLQSGNALGGTAAGNTTVFSNATLRLDNGITVPGGNLTAARGALTINGNGVGGIGALVSGTAGGNNTWFGNVSLDSASTISSGTTNGSLLGIGDPNEGESPLTQLQLGANDLTFIGGTNTTTFVSSNMTGTGNVVVNTAGTVEYYMFGNTYNGTTTVSNGTLILFTLSNTIPYGSGLTGNSAQLAIQGNLTIGDGTGAAGTARVQFGPTAEVTDANYIISMNSSVNIKQDGILDTNGFAEQIGSLTMNGATVTTNGTTGATPYGRLIVGPGSNVTVAANPVYSHIIGNFTMGNSSGGTLTGFNVTAGGNTTSDLLVDARTDGGALYKYGNGTMTLTNNNIYTGTTEVANGTLNIQNGHALGNNNDDTVLKGTTVDSGGQLQLQGGIIVDTYHLILNGNGTSNGALENVSGNNTWTGTVQIGSSSANINSTSAGNLTVSGNIGVVSGSPTLTVYGGGNTSFSGNINGALSLVKNGTGTLTLNGTATNTFTGNTTINAGTLAMDKVGAGNPAAISGSNIIINTGGTLLSQNDNQILANTNMNLAGGTWNANGYDEGLGSLTLSASSYLELGNTSGTPLGTSQIMYDVSNYATSWTSGQNLYILDWNGNLSGNQNTQVYFGTNYGGLGGSGSSQQFSQIIFVNPVGLASGNYIATILSTGEVVPFLPAPEPGTVAVGAGLGTLVMLYEWHRRKTLKTV